MAEPESNHSTGQDQRPQRQLAIQKIYLKDLSFESPTAPEVFRHKFEPRVNVNLNSTARPIGEDNYEVVLSITVTLTQEEKTNYLIELQQAGIFTAKGFPKQEIGPLLGSYCPNVLFPYAREAISDIVTKGGFPQFLLTPVNFDALYAEHAKQRAQQNKTQSAEVKH